MDEDGTLKVPGVYQLHLQLDAPARIAVGRLGTFDFPAGRYIYTGSARGGLGARLARHRRSEKALHWHIDYLLQYARIVDITTVATSERLECALNAQALQQPGARIPVPGFGSSDCRCPAHLIYLEEALQPPGTAGVPPANPGVPPANPGVPPAPAPAKDKQDEHKGWHSRGYLPHFDAAHTLQFITFRLYDSVPAQVIEHWKADLRWTERTPPDSQEAATLRKKVEEYADSGKGACYLRDERVAALVTKALKHFDGERYRLIAWCIMPNHVHVLIEEMPGHSLSDVIHSWKSFTAHQANKLLGRRGAFWAPDYFDRFIRDQEHLDATVEYIQQNPVKAGLVAAPEGWPWSSAGEVSGNPPGNK